MINRSRNGFHTAPMSKQEIIKWLKEEDPRRLEELWRWADIVREASVGPEIHLRAIIEISNYCRRACGYCGINCHNNEVDRYRLSEEQILNSVRQVADDGFRTVVLQSGEDYGFSVQMIDNLIRKIKSQTGLAVTLSLGEREKSELRQWKLAGADRYLLKIETSNPQLFNRIHPMQSSSWSNRLEMLHFLMDLGFEIGSGIMVGIPGQTYEDLADDLLTFWELDIDMLGIGPFIPHPLTALGQNNYSAFKDQTPNTEITAHKVNALARVFCPDSNIPTTTALATLNKTNGRILGLQRGANVIMPNMTPIEYRPLYQIYPGRVCLDESGKQLIKAIHQTVKSLGRVISDDIGMSRNYLKRTGKKIAI